MVREGEWKQKVVKPRVGQSVRLAEDNESVGCKRNDTVRVTSVRNLGTDYENIRVSNGSYSWRVSYVLPLEAK